MRYLLGVLGVCLMLGSGVALAEGLKITKVVAPVLMIWGDTEGNTLIKEIPAAQIKGDLPVSAVSPNLMLKVNVDGTEGWVFGHHVKTNKKPKLSAGCDQQVAQEDVGATRGLGEGCN